jgi:hypothetical protein
MNRPRALSIARLPEPMNGHFAALHFVTGVLIGAVVLAVVFVLV